MAPLISEAKQQLLDESDYQLEARHLQRYQENLASFEQFKIPKVD